MVALEPKEPAGAQANLLLAGAADNRGNAYVVGRVLTTKFPLICFLMEIAARCERVRLFPSLLWVPREQNLDAGALSNGNCAAFSPALR
eukprot:4038837-Lingulodinium_polyedra.AAC.1